MDFKPLIMVKNCINSSFATKEPWQIVAITTSSVLFTVWIYECLQEEDLVTRVKNQIFRLVRKIPSVKKQIDDELEKLEASFHQEMVKRSEEMNYVIQLPQNAKTKEQILELMRNNLKLGEFDWKHGKVSGSVYYSAIELNDLMKEVYGLSSYTNPLHPDIFPGICKMEAEVVRIAVELFHGGKEGCGTMTSGGTESILMACKAYRDYGRTECGIRKPNMVIPTTAHSAFEKAGLYLGITVKKVPIDPITMKVNVKQMRSAIDSNTVMLVGSAPNYPYGTIDDIREIGALGVKYGVPVHVDSCLGGFLTAFMPDAGYSLKPVDFLVTGVTSISADTHKYAFTPKGSSLVLYKYSKYRKHQYTVTTDWPGGVYGSPTVSGSRAGGNIAACWATMLKFGKSGYVAATKEIVGAMKYIESNLRGMENIFVYGKPETSVIAVGSKVFDIYRLSSEMVAKGWNLNALQFPPGLHICVTHMHTQAGVADKFVQDVRDSIEDIMKDPTAPVEGKMAIYGLAQGLPDRSVVGEFISLFLDSNYLTPDSETTAQGGGDTGINH